MELRIFSVIFTCLHFSFVKGSGSNASHESDGGAYGGRIIHGVQADPKEFLFAVRLESDDSICGGSIISNHYILTAAHCMHNMECTSIGISPPNWAVGDVPKFHAVECMEHAYYRAPEYSNDIGLIKSAENLLVDGGLERIDLPDPGTHFDDGTDAIIVGWGLTEVGIIPEHLLRATTVVQRWQDCNLFYREKPELGIERIPWEALCVIGNSLLPSGGCFGDSGGPIIINGVLAGVMIAAIHDTDNRCIIGTPTLGLSVVEFLSWINSHTYSDEDTDWGADK